MHLLIAALALVSFVVYGVAMKRLFSSEHGVDRRMQVLKACGAISAVVHLAAIWLAQPLVGMQSVSALGVYLLALYVFFTARRSLDGYRLTLAFSQDVPGQVVTRGIYGRVRHPFYLAYSLTWLAGVLAAPGPATAITAVLMVSFYWKAARLEEKKFLQSPLAEAYRGYMRRAGMFIPKDF